MPIPAMHQWHRWAAAFDTLQQATMHIAQNGMRDPEEAGAAATDYLRLMGLVALGYMWARSSQIAAAKLPSSNGEAGFYQAKLTTGQFFNDRLLPQTGALFAAIRAGKESMMALGRGRLLTRARSLRAAFGTSERLGEMCHPPQTPRLYGEPGMGGSVRARSGVLSLSVSCRPGYISL